MDKGELSYEFMERNDKIIFYLKGRLTAEDQSRFEEEMENDQGLVEEVDFQSTMVAVAHHIQEGKLKALMENHMKHKREDPGGQGFPDNEP